MWVVLSEQDLVGRHCTWRRNTIFFVTFFARIFPKNSFWSPSRNPQTLAEAERENLPARHLKLSPHHRNDVLRFLLFQRCAGGARERIEITRKKKLHNHAHSERDCGIHAPATLRWPLRLAQVPLTVSKWSTEITKTTFFSSFSPSAVFAQ